MAEASSSAAAEVHSRYRLSFEPCSLCVTTTDAELVVWAGGASSRASRASLHKAWPKVWGASLEATATEADLLKRLLAAGAPGVSVAQVLTHVGERPSGA